MIIILTQCFPPTIGGIENLVVNLSIELSKTYKVLVLADHHDKKNDNYYDRNNYHFFYHDDQQELTLYKFCLIRLRDLQQDFLFLQW